jgi:hypothetical protein
MIVPIFGKKQGQEAEAPALFSVTRRTTRRIYRRFCQQTADHHSDRRSF